MRAADIPSQVECGVEIIEWLYKAILPSLSDTDGRHCPVG